MSATKIMLVIGIVITLWGCAPGNREQLAKEEKNDSTSNAFISSSAAVENKKDTTRKFIRTAELKFKVKSVIKSTYDIENITNRQGGFVTYTNLTSTIEQVTTTAVSADSSLVSTYYTVTNLITLRVPNTRLDTTLKEIALNIDYLDYRIIKAEDVALDILSNTLTQKRSAKNEERLTAAIDKRGKKLGETAYAEEILLNKQEDADRAKISNLSLADQINFSTVNLSIYQREALKREVIANDKNIDAYEPGFGKKLVEALKTGWDVLAEIIVFVTKLWGVFLFAIVSFIIYKYVKKNK
jgi:hypothetical protein